jgi:hypothetical protein
MIMQLPNASVRSPTYYVARTVRPCPYCGKPNRLLALALPPNHETLDTEAPKDGVWQTVRAHAFLFHVTELPDAVQRHLAQLLPLFRIARGTGTLNGHWANHCEHCGLSIDDQELHCEPGVFMPSDEAEAAGIQLLPIGEAFEAVAAGYALEPEYFRCMRRS